MEHASQLCLVIEADTLTQPCHRAAFLDTLLTSHLPKRGSSCRVLSPRSSHWSRLLNRFRCASTITFCQSWSTLVSLESAFNAEQEHDIIFPITCTTKEIKIQMKSMTEETFKPLLRLIVICTWPRWLQGCTCVNSA